MNPTTAGPSIRKRNDTSHPVSQQPTGSSTSIHPLMDESLQAEYWKLSGPLCAQLQKEGHESYSVIPVAYGPSPESAKPTILVITATPVKFEITLPKPFELGLLLGVESLDNYVGGGDTNHIN